MPDFRPFLLWVFISVLAAKSWHGHVYTDQNRPLEYAYIIHLKTQNFTVSDGDGFFVLTGLYFPGDSIRVERYGYESRYITLPNDDVLAIKLTTRPVGLPAVEAVEQGDSGLMESADQYETSAGTRIGVVTQKGLLETLPGVSIRTYGGPGSVGFMSIDGGVAPHTNVTFNGLDMNNAQTGLTDVSQLPAAFFRSVRLNPHGFNDGTVAIYLWNEKTIQVSAGSFQRRSLSLAHSFSRNRLVFRIGWHGSDEAGDYPVSWRDESILRRNNDFSQQALVSQLDYFLSPRVASRLFFFHSRQNRGNPGQVWSPSEARRKDDLTLASCSLVTLRKSGTRKTILSWKRPPTTIMIRPMPWFPVILWKLLPPL